jgi:stearoyl-CoA desaturase (delta-9 desaturase)
VKIYNFVGYSIIALYLAGCAFFAPAHIGPWLGMLIGTGYFVLFWLLAGVYLADVLHLGIAHRSLDYQDWFIKTVVIANNLFGVYVDPTAWVNRHRLHHKYSDHPGDPNKLSEDGFWRTLYLCLVPYKCDENLANDKIFKSWPFKLVSNNYFALFSQAFSILVLWAVLRDWALVLVMWLGFRIFALWVNMIQNYWTHTRSYGTRRYQDEHDNAMNISEWLPVTATFSACLQNNHHHSPGMLRLSHHSSEYDFGFLTVKVMKSLGLVRATARGAELPDDVPLRALNF